MRGLIAFVLSIVVSIAAPRAVQSSPGTAVAPAFARNTGQTSPAARFLSIGGGQPVFFTSNDVRIVDTRQKRSLWLMFVDGAARALDGDAPTGGHVTVLRRPNATSDSPLYRDVVYRSIWPGVDVRVSAAAIGIKYSFEVSPGGDPRKIRVRYGGADRIALTAAGELRLDVGDSTIVDSKPVASQRINGRDVPVEVHFVHHGTDVTFAVGKYDRTRDLLIDPTLVYSTYLGSSGMDLGRAIAVDSTGAAYIAGSSNYFDLPVTPGAYQTSWHGDPNTVIPDAFVAKIDPAGTHFDYVTYLGGFGRDEARGIAVDAGGNAYVTGFTDSGDFPTTAGAYRTTSSTRDGFLTKLNNTGTALVYSTFLGGNSTTFGNSVAVDSGGDAYVVGETQATNLPVSPGGVPYSHAPGSDHAFENNGFLLKLNADGSDVLFGTYIGGNGPSVATGVAVTGTGTASVTGWTRSFDGIAGNAIAGTNGHSVQGSPNGPTYKSTDGAQTFSSTNTRATASSAFAIDSTSPDTVYQGTFESGVLKTTDGGAHWTVASAALGGNPKVWDLAIDLAAPNILLATTVGGSVNGMWRSVDSGATWNEVSPLGLFVAFAPSAPSIAYSSWRGGFLRSTDAGATWTQMLTTDQFTMSVYGFAIDPTNESVVYVGLNSGQILMTTNGGFAWTPLSVPTGGGAVERLAIDPTSANVIWAGSFGGDGGRVFRSTNRGGSWTRIPDVGLRGISRMLFDGGTLYVAEYDHPEGTFSTASYGLVRTSDGGDTWSFITIRGSRFPVRGLAALNGLVYAGGDLYVDAFLRRVDTNAGAQAFTFGTYLGGALDDLGRGVAIDPAGNAVVAVETYSGDFPTTVAGAMTNGALARISPDGTALATSRYIGDPNAPTIPTGVAVDSNQAAYISSSQAAFGETAVRVDRIDPSGVGDATIVLDGTHSNVGAANDFPNGIAAGPVAGEVFVTGRTASTDFPTTPGAPQPFYGSGSADAFIAKVSFGGSSPQTNLALNKPVFVSSEFSVAYAGGLAVDGNPSTRWSSQFSDPQWIYVDLGQPYAITRVILRWETAFGADYQVQVSNDASHWTTVLTIAGGGGDVDDLPGISGTGRYVRIYGTRRGTEWGYSLWELEVFGTLAPPPVDVARNKPVVTSSDFSAQYAGRFAVDGDGSTRWSSEFSDPQWIYVDLGQRFQINRVVLTWEAAYGADYELQISNDARHWATIATAQNNTQLTNDWGVGGLGRYVRMFGTRRGTEWGYSLWSFEVYGTPGTDNTDIALNHPATSSSDFSSQYAAALAVDGDASTRWSSEFSDPQWIAVDLGQITVINEVRLTWETAYGADYEIQMSDDGISWLTVLTVTGATGGVDDLVAGGTGRYVRMYGTRRGTEWGYSLWSFEVYGHPTP